MRCLIMFHSIAITLFVAVGPVNGNTLITLAYPGNRVIEIDSSGTIVWEMNGLRYPKDAERLSNGNTLIIDDGRVIEIDSSGTIVWERNGLFDPCDIERLDNRNTLITESDGRVIEIDSSGTIVWEMNGLRYPKDTERLRNGNTLIALTYPGNRVIEIDSSGTIVWEMNGLRNPIDAERLENGNTLITDEGRVIEIDSSGTIVWEMTGLRSLKDAERLSNGNTLIALAYPGNRVIEIDSSGTIVWEMNGLSYVLDVERIGPEEPPNTHPIADVGEDQTVAAGDIVYLNGSESYDPEGDVLGFAWFFDTLPVDSLTILINGDTAEPNFIADVEGQYTVSLIVSDEVLSSEPNTIIVTAIPPEDAVEETLIDINEIIVDLPPESLNNENSTNALSNKIDAVIAMIDQGLYEDALDKMQNDILKKTNGCASEEGIPDNNDWILTCEDQAIVYPLVQRTIELLMRLIE